MACFTCDFRNKQGIMSPNRWLIDDLIFCKIATSERKPLHRSCGIGYMSWRHMPDIRR